MKIFTLTTKIERICKYIDEGFESLKLSRLYSTKEGKKLGRDLEDLSSFVFAMTFLTFPVAKLKNAWITLVKRDDIKKLKPHSEGTSEKDFEEFEKFMIDFAHLLDDSDDDDFGVIFGRKGIRRFLALQSLSAYAYVDSYSKKMVQNIIESESHGQKVILYLEENDIRNNKDDSSVKTLKQVKSLGLHQRLDILEKVLDVRDNCIQYVDDEMYDRYRKLFAYFIRLRGRMAHDDPEPSLSKFDHKFFKSAKRDVRKAFSIFPNVEEIPEVLEPHMEIIESWFKKISSTLAVIYAVPKMIVVFTAILDNVFEINHNQI
ncbi:MAG: hypothetical protein ACTSUO_04165 [Candidatus Thorarchaeota archaeon]